MFLVIDISTSPLHPEDLLDRFIFFLRESGVEWLMSDKGSLQWFSLQEGKTRLQTLVEPGHLIFSVKPESETELADLAQIYGTLVARLIVQFGDSIRMIRIHPERSDTPSALRRDAREDTLSLIKKTLEDTELNEKERLTKSLKLIDQIL